MAAKKGQLVFGTLVTPAASSFPIVDSDDVGGGRHFVDSIAERNSIPASHRKTGMVVYVGGTVKKDYILKAGAPTTGPTTDANWEDYAPGVPAGILTEHQKAEDIEYRTPYAPGKSTLLQKIEDLEAEIDSKLSTHQKVEDILYENPGTSGFTSLIKKLQDMDTKIAAAGAPVHIEDVTWSSLPSDLHDHKSNLGEELESIWTIMNDPTKIMVIDGATSLKVTLQNKIAALEDKVPYADAISMSSGDPTKITSYLTNAANAINTIKYDTTQTLKEKIDSLASAISSQTVESINWGTAPSGTGRSSSLATEINTIFSTLANMNDPTQITIPAAIIGTTGDKNLNEAITELKGLISAASGVPTVELIKWNTPRTGTGRNQDLYMEIDYIFTTLADMNDPTKINIPASVMGSAGTLNATLTTLKGLIDTNTSAIGDSSTGLIKDVNDLKASVGDSTAGLIKDVNALKATVGDSTAGLVKDTSDLKTAVGDSTAGLIKDVNDLKSTVGDATSGLVKDVNALKAATADYAKKDASNITVSADATGTTTDNLNTVLQTVFASLGNVVIPQILLFNTSSPAVGALTSQEFLTNQKVKVKDMAIYTNVDATTAVDISAKLEYCAADGTAYSDLDSTTTITLSAGTKQNSVDLSASNIVVNAGSRLRLNITAFDSSNVVDVLNVRVILEPTA